MDPDIIPERDRTPLGLEPGATPDGADLVLIVIASLNGGRNGANPDRILGIEITGPGEATYTLTDVETGDVQTYRVTVEAV